MSDRTLVALQPSPYGDEVEDVPTTPADIITHLLERPNDAQTVGLALKSAKIAGPWEIDFGKYGEERKRRNAVGRDIAWVAEDGGEPCWGTDISPLFSEVESLDAGCEAANAVLVAAGWVLADGEDE